MRGVNKIVISGSVSRDVKYVKTRSGVDVCTFGLTSERGAHKVYAKINVYMDWLVGLCKETLGVGDYVIVEGELMNRDGRSEALTEVRARDIVFVEEEMK